MASTNGSLNRRMGPTHRPAPDLPAPARRASPAVAAVAVGALLGLCCVAGTGASTVVSPEPMPLRQVSRDSSLIVVATVGPQVGIERGHLQTELEVTAVLKGEPGARTVTVDHSAPAYLLEEGDERLLRPGDTVLAFLRPLLQESPADPHAYAATDPLFGLKELSPDVLQAYRRRIAALGRSLPEPEEVAEWLVATAEDPLTRYEAMGELRRADESAAALARRQAEPRTPETEARDRWESGTEMVRIGTALTDHRDRLVRALLATERVAEGDIDLFELVRPWAGEPALHWLIQRFQGGEPASDGLAHRVMALLAAELDAPDLRWLVQEAEEETKGLWVPVVVGSPEQTAMDEQATAVEKDLRERFLRALANRR